jgi:tRNA (cytidine32/uridine32-2'-O)-methyltransferase
VLDRLRIVLLAPSGPANVGAVCRIMANMGFRDLVIVAPRCDIRDEAAVAYAMHGTDVLDNARVVNTLSEALADCVRSYITSSKLGIYRRQNAITPAEAAPEAIDLATNAGPVAIAFGREDYGITTPELLEFDRLVTIPANEDYPVLNLAAAVTVLCYELRRTWHATGAAPALPMAIDPGVATHAARDVMFTKLFDALDKVGFFATQNPDHLKYALRHLFGRLDLGVNECDILIGMAQQIRYYVDQHPGRRDPPASANE